MFNTEVISYADQLYTVYRKFKDFENFPKEEVKEHYRCDRVLRKHGVLFFCRLIEDAKIIQEDE